VQNYKAAERSSLGRLQKAAWEDFKKQKKERENKTKKEDYNRFWIHKSNVCESLDLALREWILISFSNKALTAIVLGCLFLKIKSFRAFQIAHLIRIVTIKKKLGCDCALTCSTAKIMS